MDIINSIKSNIYIYCISVEDVWIVEKTKFTSNGITAEADRYIIINYI
jgi:hypothetical protein